MSMKERSMRRKIDIHFTCSILELHFGSGPLFCYQNLKVSVMPNLDVWQLSCTDSSEVDSCFDEPRPTTSEQSDRRKKHKRKSRSRSRSRSPKRKRSRSRTRKHKHKKKNKKRSRSRSSSSRSRSRSSSAHRAALSSQSIVLPITSRNDDDDDDDVIGPQPLLQTNVLDKSAYGTALLPGEGQAIAQYVLSSSCIQPLHSPHKIPFHRSAHSSSW